MAIMPICETAAQIESEPTANNPLQPWLKWTGGVVMTTFSDKGFLLSDQELESLRKQLNEDALEEVQSTAIEQLDDTLLFTFMIEGTERFAAYSIVGLAVQAAINTGYNRQDIHMQSGYLLSGSEIMTSNPRCIERQEERDTLMEDVCYDLNIMATGRIPSLQSVV